MDLFTVGELSAKWIKSQAFCAVPGRVKKEVTRAVASWARIPLNQAESLLALNMGSRNWEKHIRTDVIGVDARGIGQYLTRCEEKYHAHSAA